MVTAEFIHTLRGSSMAHDFSGFDYIIQPGWNNSGPEHWQSRWEARHGHRRVEQDDWLWPRRGDWMARLEDALRKLREDQAIGGKFFRLRYGERNSPLSANAVALASCYNLRPYSPAAVLAKGPASCRNP